MNYRREYEIRGINEMEGKGHVDYVRRSGIITCVTADQTSTGTQEDHLLRVTWENALDSHHVHELLKHRLLEGPKCTFLTQFFYDYIISVSNRSILPHSQYLSFWVQTVLGGARSIYPAA